MMQVFNDDDLYGGQRPPEVKCGKLCDALWLPYLVKRIADASLK